MRRTLPCSLAPILSSLAATAVLAQAPVSSPPVFGERTEVAVQNVDVVVEDRDGRPVRGLAAADFEVRVDGAVVPITNFYAVESGALRAPALDPSVPGAQPEEPVIATESAPRRASLLLFVDQTNLAPANRKRVLGAVREHFRDLRAATAPRVAIVAYDGGVTLRRPFTENLQEIDDALADLIDKAPKAERFDLEIEQIKRELEEASNIDDAAGADAGMFAMRVRSYSERRMLQVRATIAALGQLIEAAAGIPGTKSVLYVGDGLPLRPGEPLAELWANRFPLDRDTSRVTTAARSDTIPDFDRLIDAANRARVTFYPLYSAVSGATARGSAATTERVPDTPAMVDASFQSALDAVAQEPLRDLARSTGGRFAPTVGAWDEALTALVSDVADYYSLGIPPTTDAEARIEVSVDRPGVVVRHRRQLGAMSSDERLAARTYSVLLFGGAENPLGTEVRLGTPETQPDGTFLVTANLLVPIGRLLLAPAGEVHEGRFSLAAAARHEKGALTGLARFVCPLRIPSADVEVARTRSIACGVRLHMAKGAHEIAISMRDELSTEESTATTTLVLPPRTGG
jgi:VWFA-related protein